MFAYKLNCTSWNTDYNYHTNYQYAALLYVEPTIIKKQLLHISKETLTLGWWNYAIMRIIGDLPHNWANPT